MSGITAIELKRIKMTFDTYFQNGLMFLDTPKSLDVFKRKWQMWDDIWYISCWDDLCYCFEKLSFVFSFVLFVLKEPGKI